MEPYKELINNVVKICNECIETMRTLVHSLYDTYTNDIFNVINKYNFLFCIENEDAIILKSNNDDIPYDININDIVYDMLDKKYNEEDEIYNIHDFFNDDDVSKLIDNKDTDFSKFINELLPVTDIIVKSLMYMNSITTEDGDVGIGNTDEVYARFIVNIPKYFIDNKDTIGF